jgi:hypothetical protein
MLNSVVVESDLSVTVPTEVSQEAVWRDGAAEVLLQVVRPVEEGLQLLCKAFVAGLGLKLNEDLVYSNTSLGQQYL